VSKEDNAYGLSGTVIVTLPVDPKDDLKALRRYSESPNPPTKTILYFSLVPVFIKSMERWIERHSRMRCRGVAVVTEGLSKEIGHSSIH
jgi:hypothetical protein